MSGWNPIDTAPKDGTWVLIRGGKPDYDYDEDRGLPPCVVAQWRPTETRSILDREPGLWRFCSYDSGYYGQWHDPVEWMPLPAT